MKKQEKDKENPKVIVLELSAIPLIVNGKKGLQIKKTTQDMKLIKEILESAFKEDFIPAKIIFRDRFKAYLRCSELGLIEEGKISIPKIEGEEKKG